MSTVTPKPQSTYRNGLYTEEEFLEKVTKGEIQYVILCIQTVSHLMYKTYEAKFFSKHVLKDGTNISQIMLTANIGFDYIKTGSISSTGSGVTVDIEVDRNTFRAMTWQGGDYAICFGNVRRSNGELHPLAPRNTLVNTLKKYKEKSGLTFQCASEMEYFIFNKQNTEITKNYPSMNLTDSAMSKKKEFLLGHTTSRVEPFTRMLKDHIKNSGVELEGLIEELSPGQQELNYVYGEALKSCDNHTMIKQCIKHLANVNNLGCSFMAKPFADYSGSASHIHLSVVDANGRNYFAPSNYEKENSEFTVGEKKIRFHSRMAHFIGGILKYNRELFLIYAPVINSFKRFRKSMLTPYFVNTWGYDNKYSMIRVIGNEEDIHIEVRIAGADANIYNILTAMIASGMKGVEEKITPPEIESSNAFESSKKDYVAAPKNLDIAADIFEESVFAQEVFGKDMQELLVNMAREEWNQYEMHISNFEINRYLDHI